MFDQGKADAHIEFLELLKLTGDFFGKPFKLLPWQRDVIGQVYGTVDERGRRQYQYAYLEIPKKNGKTELIASLAVDHCLNDDAGGQIYCCAAEREQASLVYLAAKSKIEQDEYLSEAFRVVDSKKEIHNRETGTFIKVLSAEAYGKHGLNPSVVIFDELHALQKRDLWDVMTFGSGAARPEQLVWIITTAGDDPDRKSIGWEQHDYARKVRDGEIEDPTWFVRIYGAPDDADIWDEEVWKAANPSLGVTIPIENVRKEALAARNSEAAEKNFRWLRLNQWISLKRIGWMPLSVWDATENEYTPADLEGQECYLGLDLSSTTDITAIAALFPPRGQETRWRSFVDAFIPEEGMKQREDRDHVPFRTWVKHGFVRATIGECIDYSEIAARISWYLKKYKVLAVAADEWRLQSLVQLMDETVAQRIIVTIPQTIAGMSPGMAEMERLMRNGEMTHAKNPCARWAFGNVVVITDGNENKKPDKKRSRERIDPIVAMIDAMAAAIRMEKKRSAYEGHGLRTL
nr:MAG TPA: Large Terminase [Caudoviricetes sp.]